MARKRHLFLHYIKSLLKRSKRLRFLALFLLGLILTLFPWFPGSAWEPATRGSGESCPSCQMSGSIVAGGRVFQLAERGGSREREKREKAQYLNQQGSQMLARGKAAAALEMWEKAEALYAEVDYKKGVIGSQINQAHALEALGHYRKSCDRIMAALGSEYKCEDLEDLTENNLAQELDRFQLPDDLNFIGLQSLGNILRRIGKLEESQQVLESSWAVEKLLGKSETESQAWLSLGNTARARAKKYQDLENTDEANKYNIEAVEDYQHAAEMTKSANTKLQAQMNQLRIVLTEEYLPEFSIVNTSKLLSGIKSMLAELPQSKMAVHARINLACSLLSCDRLSEASGRKENYLLPIDEIEALLKTAAKDAESLGDPEGKSHALGSLGMLYAQTGKRDDAKRMTRDALHVAMASNAGHIAYQWQWQMGRLLMQEEYGAKEAIAQRQQQGDRKRAIEHYRAAFETLNSVRRDLLSINDVEFSFRVQVEPVYRELVDLLLLESDRVSDESLIKEAVEVIDALRLAELENFLNCNLLNTDQSDREDTEEVSVEEVARKAALIYPIILPDRLEIIFKFPGEGWNHRSRAIGKMKEVEDTLERLRKNLKKRRGTEEVKKDGQKVYDWLIKPIEEDLENLRSRGELTTLVFGLDDSLRNIPMAVLYNKGEYLIEKYAIAVILSRQLFEARPQQQKISVLTAGVEQAQQNVEGQKFEELQYVPIELKEIQKVMGLPKEPLLNDEFTQKQLEEQIDSAIFPIVHIATHGKFSSDPDETFILAWNELIKVKEFEKILQINNPNRSQAIELLVLSACETAQGNRRAALGLAGVAVQARVRSTVATLWQVDDKITSELMGKFYEELKDGKTIAEALRQAQLYILRMRKPEPEQRTYFWAPYILVGNWQSRFGV